MTPSLLGTRCRRASLWPAMAIALPALAFAQPVVDGDLEDLLAFVPLADCGLISNDAAEDVCKTDPNIVPCVAEVPCAGGAGTYFVNGFDVVTAVVAYDAGGDVAYFGFRTAGNIGDSNGDGDPGVGACANPASNILDLAGIGSTESYLWLLDTNCDGQPNVQISFTNNGVSVNPPAGATSASFNGTDLEVSVAGLGLPPIWRLSTFVGSTTDGLSEDTSPPQECPPPNLDLEIQKSSDVDALCPGETVRFTIDVTNTGTATLNVSVEDVLPVGLAYADNESSDCGPGNVVGQTITWPPFDLDPGATWTCSFDATAGPQCFGAVENVARATGTFESSCLEAPLGVGPVEARKTVTCLPEPCVDLVTCEAPAAACDGDEITVTGSARNCSAGPENITITISGPSGVIGSQTFPDVSAGETVTLDVVTPQVCNGASGVRLDSRRRSGSLGSGVEGAALAQAIRYEVVAVAANTCGETEPVLAECFVECNPEPCVELVLECPEEACEGDPLELCATAINCSAGPADIVVTVAGDSRSFLGVPAGASVIHCVDTTMPACNAGERIAFDASAVATNACGEVRATASCEVECLPESCVEIIAFTGPASAPPGEDFEICVTARNCSPGAEDIRLELGGTSELFPSVPAGGTVTLCVRVSIQTCGPEGFVVFTAEARATNRCGEATDAAVLPVECEEECPFLIIIDEETIDNDIKSIEAAAASHGIEPDVLVNDDRPTEVGNPCLVWSRDFAGDVVTLPSGQLFDEGLVALPANPPFSIDDYVAGTVPQDQLDKIADVTPLRNPELEAMKGKSFLAVVYDSDISMNYDPINGNLKGARYGLFAFTVLDVIEPGTLPESGSSSSLKDLVIRVDPCPADLCVTNFAQVVQSGQMLRPGAGSRGLRTTGGGGVVGGEAPGEAGRLALYRPAPNPFTATTRIAYAVSGSGASVEIGIYDVSGRRVRKLVGGFQAAGRHEVSWDGRDDFGSNVARGVYFLRAFVDGRNVSHPSRILYLR